MLRFGRVREHPNAIFDDTDERDREEKENEESRDT
jgi:hypothetical protein